MGDRPHDPGPKHESTLRHFEVDFSYAGLQHRRLATEGASYLTLMNEVRIEVAQQQLGNARKALPI